MSIWKAEEEMLTRQNLDYKRSPMEWEILGDLALHLHNIKDAKDAYQRSLEGRPSQKIMNTLAEIYIKESKLSHALSILLRMLKFYHARYQTFTSMSAPYRILVKLVRKNGFRKVQDTMNVILKASNENSESQQIVASIFELVNRIEPIGVKE